jgi:zinc D-Ala-D-Ala carboxypeptidase
MKISTNLSVEEVSKSLTATRKGIDNTPKGDHLNNLISIAQNIFQPIRNHFGAPIFVSSGYRSEALNKAIGGAHKIIKGKYVATSQHCNGEALDLDNDAVGKPSNAEIFYFIYDNLDFDQLIWEFGDSKNPDWVHVSYSSDGNNRKSTLVAERQGKSTVYSFFDDKR